MQIYLQVDTNLRRVRAQLDSTKGSITLTAGSPNPAESELEK